MAVDGLQVVAKDLKSDCAMLRSGYGKIFSFGAAALYLCSLAIPLHIRLGGRVYRTVGTGMANFRSYVSR
jgi:hypothetical protein